MIKEMKGDIKEMKGDIKEMKAEMREEHRYDFGRDQRLAGRYSARVCDAIPAG